MPTGLSAVPPSGPATPLTARRCRRGCVPAHRPPFRHHLGADRAMAGEGRFPHAEQLSLGHIAVGDETRSNQPELPAISVTDLPIQPPVQDSATARICLRAHRTLPTWVASS